MHDHLTRALWRKSSLSGSGNACVEVANLGASHAVRDSKNPTTPALVFTTAQWSAFTTATRCGAFD